MRSAIGVAILSLIGLSVQADEPQTMPQPGAAPSAASTGGNSLQPICGPADCATSCGQGDCCCGGVHCGCGCGFYAGAEAAVLRPYFNNNTALLAYTVSTASVSTTDFTPSYAASPRIWRGYSGQCGFGARLTYWDYDQAASSPAGVQSGQNLIYFVPGITSSVPAITLGNMQTDVPGDTLTASEHLHMYTLDVDVTQCLQICCWDFTFGGGLRDASVHISRENTLIPAGTTTPFEDATIDNNFDGVGPTLFAEFRRPFCSCGLSFVGGVRGSLLYGTKSLNVNDVFPTVPRTQTYHQSDDGCLGVVDLCLGIGWDRSIGCNATLFTQCLWEGQFWSNFGNSLGSTSDSLGLSGVGIAVGITH